MDRIGRKSPLANPTFSTGCRGVRGNQAIDSMHWIDQRGRAIFDQARLGRRPENRRVRTCFGCRALAAALAASPALAGQDYPPGLFERSPVVPSGPPDATAPSGPPELNRSFWTARHCRSFSTSGRGRPAGRLLRWRRLPDLSQSGGSQAGARSVRSGSQRRAAVAARREPARRIIGMYVDGLEADREPVKLATLHRRGDRLQRCRLVLQIEGIPMLKLETKADLQRLIDDEIPESLTLDYKASALLGRKNDQRNELFKVVSPFANSAGGQ